MLFVLFAGRKNNEKSVNFVKPFKLESKVLFSNINILCSWFRCHFVNFFSVFYNFLCNINNDFVQNAYLQLG